MRPYLYLFFLVWAIMGFAGALVAGSSQRIVLMTCAAMGFWVGVCIERLGGSR